MSADPAAAPAGSARQAARLLTVASVVLPLLLFFASAAFDRAAILDSARNQVLSICDSLAGQAQDVVDTADQVLKRQLDHIHGEDWRTIGASASLHDFLVSAVHELPQLQSAFYVDPQGFNSNSSRAFPMRPFDVRMRDYYLAALAGDAGAYVSAPFRGQMAGSAAFTISRSRITAGAFNGLAAVTIEPAYFQNFYAEVIRRWPTAVAMFMRTDGAVLARYPVGTDPLARVPMTGTLLHLAATEDRGLATARSKIDGRVRIGAFRHLADPKLMVVYSVEEAAVLRVWYVHVALFAAFAALGSFALLMTARVVFERAEREQKALRLLLDETSRRQRAEAALLESQKMEALGRLTGGVAHDFNNLLTAVLGSLELARKRVEDSRTTRLLENAAAAAERGARLTAQMLAFARREDTALCPVGVNDIAAALEPLIRQTLGSGVALAMELAPDLWPAIGEKLQLEMALLNFAANARDAMPAGGRFTIATRNRHLDAEAGIAGGLAGAFVEIAAADTGSGMPAEVRARAFEPFYTTKGAGKGTGLGLSTVYGFAVQAGGGAAIADTPGGGTTLLLYLPRADPAPPDRPAAR